MANKTTSYWPHVVNLANSIIGVSVLALPLCFQNCGVLLGLILMLTSAWLSYVSCVLLTKSASITRKRSYEFLAFNIFGQSGKLAVEIGTMGLMLGTLVAFFIILGDLCPFIISNYFSIENSVQLRTTTLLFLGLFVVLPLSMKTNLESISKLSTMSLSFYAIFALQTIFSSFPHLKTWEFVRGVKYWDVKGLFSSLPIFALSYACQIQLFLIYHSVPEISIKETSIIVKRSIILSSTIYFSVAYFGYIAFYDHPLNGDVLMNFPTTPASTFIKVAFCASTIFSFPLCIFPCRNSLYTLLFSESLHDNLGGQVHIPMNVMKLMTFALVAFTLTIGILVPKVEFILGLTGSTLGSLICFLLPSATYLKSVHHESTFKKIVAKIVMFTGMTILIVSTLATLSAPSHQHPLVNLEDRHDHPSLDLPPLNNAPVLPPLSASVDTNAKLEPVLAADANAKNPSLDAVPLNRNLNPILPDPILPDPIPEVSSTHAPPPPSPPSHDDSHPDDNDHVNRLAQAPNDRILDESIKGNKKLSKNDVEDFNNNKINRNNDNEDVAERGDNIVKSGDSRKDKANMVETNVDTKDTNRENIKMINVKNTKDVNKDAGLMQNENDKNDVDGDVGGMGGLKEQNGGVESIGDANNKMNIDNINNNNNNNRNKIDGVERVKGSNGSMRHASSHAPPPVKEGEGQKADALGVPAGDQQQVQQHEQQKQQQEQQKQQQDQQNKDEKRAVDKEKEQEKKLQEIEQKLQRLEEKLKQNEQQQESKSKEKVTSSPEVEKREDALSSQHSEEVSTNPPQQEREAKDDLKEEKILKEKINNDKKVKAVTEGAIDEGLKHETTNEPQNAELEPPQKAPSNDSFIHSDET